MLNNYDNLINIKEAAEMLCVAPTTMYMWVAAGRVPHIRLGNRCIRFQVAQLLEFIRNNSVEAEKEAAPKAPMPRQPRKRHTNKISNNKYLDDLLEHAKNDVLNKN